MGPDIRAFACLGFLSLAPSAWADPSASVLDPSIPDRPHVLSVGGGALGFVGQYRDPTLARATSWVLRYGYRPATTVTWELAYMGATDVTPVGRSDVPGAEVADRLFVTLVDLDLRVNIVPMTSIYPFVTGGIGYGGYERAATGDDYTTMSVPLAAGVEWLAGGLALESRLQYRPTFYDDDVAFTRNGLDTWLWTGSVGARF